MAEDLVISHQLLQTDEFWQDGRSAVASSGVGGAPPASVLPEGSVAFATSGSTGEPSWIVISKASLLVSAAAVNQHLAISSASCWGLALPLHHVGGFGVVARAHQVGCRCVVFSQKWNPHAFCEWLDSEGVSHTSLVPTQVVDLVVAGLRSPSAVRAVVVGGGRLSEKSGQAARDLGWPVLASYGMTETSSQVATQGLDVLAHSYRPSPLPTLAIWQVEVDDAGCFRVAGPGLFSGKVCKEEGGWSYRERVGEWHTTRDLGQVLADGSIQVEGRADELVKVLGELVSPSRVEAMVREYGVPDSVAFAIVPVSDARMGHRLVPVFEEGGDADPITRSLARHNASCAGYLRLAPLVTIPKIPRSALGKIQRDALMHLIPNGL